MKTPLLLVAAGLAGLLGASVALADGQIDAGRALAFSKTKGNCLACHRMPDDPQAITSATIGPPLIHMKRRYPNRARLRAQIWDATVNNPNTVMPPFGRNHILTEKEIDLVTDYILSL